MTSTHDATTAARPLINAARIATVIWIVLSVATDRLADALDRPYAVVCTVLFAVGISLFLLGFWNGVQRSRVDEVTLPGLLAVSTTNVPRSVRNDVWLIVAIQVIVAVATGSLRPFTEQAFALLVPMLGIGVAALVGSRVGQFHPRG